MASGHGGKRALELQEPSPPQAKRSRWSSSSLDDGFRHEDYTVGWICALPIELAAAKSMLDRLHKPLSPLSGDSNTYTLGNIGLHNIVLACLPLTHYGTNNAAIVAANMRRSYPAIDKRLMVGIGGGLPTPSRDVRLGDIVVGTEVIQFDFGKQLSLNKFKITATPTRPPQLLLTATSNLKATHEARATRVPSLLSDMIQRHPGMCTYARPNDPDYLFLSTYIHGSQDSCDHCDPSQTKNRGPRINPAPLIHYGTVGSSNTVVKDSQTRDKLAEELGIICVEMEAAGLMDGFPCLVIRGICDYADSHKSKNWQRYSAATAAAYAKELLLEVPGNQICKSPSGAYFTSDVSMSLHECRNVLLNSLDFPQIESRHTGIKSANVGGSSNVAFFFNARGEVLEKSIIGMYRSLLFQTFQHFPDLTHVLDKFTSKLHRYNGVFEWTVETLQKIMSEVVGALNTQSLTLFIDALDECDAEEIRDMVEYFEELGSNAFRNSVKLHICFSSRPYPHVDIQNRIRFTLEEQTEHSEDLAKYVRGKLRAGNSKLATWVYEEILRKSAGIFMWVVLAVDILNGVFRNGQLLQVKRRLQELPPKLGDLFRDILCRDGENMEDMLLCIQWVAFAKRPLTCAEYYFALATGLLPAGTALDEWDSEIITPEVMKRYVLSSSKGLAEVTTYRKTQTVNFIHESVRDFLIKDNGIQSLWPHLADNFEIYSHERLRQCCHAYLAHDKSIPEDLPCTTSSKMKILRQQFLDRFPFLGYASDYLFHHSEHAATLVPQSTFLRELNIRSWAAQFNLFRATGDRRVNPSTNLMSIFARLGCPKLAKLILAWDSGHSAFCLSSDRSTYPVFTAIEEDNIGVVKICLDEEAKAPFQEIIKLKREFISRGCYSRFGTPLHWAVSIGNMTLFRHILALAGPDCGSRNIKSLTPLSIAARDGRGDILQLLLQQPSVLIDHEDINGRTALWHACRNGHKDVVELLLATGEAGINKEDSEGRTPLSKAVENGHLAVVSQLLATGKARPDTRCNDGRTPLSYAAISGDIQIVKQLLTIKGLDLESTDIWRETPLHYASINGHAAIVSSLLTTKKVNPNRKGELERSPLSHAAEGGHTEVVRLLLSLGNVNPDFADSMGRTPLSYAAQMGHIDIVQLLLTRREVNINSREIIGKTPLHLAVDGGHCDVVPRPVTSYQVCREQPGFRRSKHPLSLNAYVKTCCFISSSAIRVSFELDLGGLSLGVNMAAEAAKPRVLCLDGGGIRGLSEILILKEIMLQVRINNGLDYTPEPYQCFDFICGTSTGGLVAVLLGRLGKTLDECEELFRKLGSEIFESSSLLKSSRLVLKGSKHIGECLSEAIRAQAGHGLMYDEDCLSTGHVPVAVVAVSKTTTNDYLFRTYGVRANTEACLIVDACRATSAATTFFPSIMINGVEYVDGAFGKNNPSGAALSELETSEWISPMKDAVNGVSCFVSVGTGRPTIKLRNSSLASSFVPGASKIIEAAKSCMKIATDCHKVHLEVATRFTKAGAKELYYRFDVDRGLESVGLDESNKEALQHISAVTKAYLRERSTEIEKCARLLVPMSSRKAALLYGIGGCGKTQLVLQHIEQHKTDYTAIIWINASNKETAVQSLEEASFMIATQWPVDRPLPSNDRSNTLSHIRSRLQHTRHQKWLLVLDSLDEPDHQFAEYIPCCNFGSVIVTSTAFRSFSGFRPKKPIEVEGLDTMSSLSLLNTTSKQTSSSEEDKMAAKAITKELSGIPLALEQAGGLISNGEFTFSQFLTSYKTNYRNLMSIRPETDMWAYDKSRVIITVIDMVIKSLGPDIKYISLLTMIAILGSWQVPISLIECFSFRQPIDEGDSFVSDEMESLHNLLRDHGFLRLALRHLASFSLVHIKEENGQLKSLFLHRIICQWLLETGMVRWKQDCIVFVSYNLAGKICEALEMLPLAGTPKRILLEGPIVDRKYLAPFKFTLSLIELYVPDITLNPDYGLMQCLYSTIVHHAAWVYNSEGDPEKGRAYFEMALEMQIFNPCLMGDEQKSRSVSLLHLTGLGQASYKMGDLTTASEALNSALDLSKSLLGDNDENTLSIAGRLRSINERQKLLERHQSKALVASTTATGRWGDGKVTPSLSHPHPQKGGAYPSYEDLSTSDMEYEELATSGVECVDFDASIMKDVESVHPLITAAAEDDESMVYLLLNEPTFNMDSMAPTVRMALQQAAISDNQKTVDIILQSDMFSVSERDVEWLTPLCVVYSMLSTRSLTELLDTLIKIRQNGHTDPIPLFALREKYPIFIQMLLERHSHGRVIPPKAFSMEQEHQAAVNILLRNSPDTKLMGQLGVLPLVFAAEEAHEGVVHLLLDKGACPEIKDEHGYSPLALAAMNGHTAVTKLLLDNGADIEVKDNNGCSPLALAARNGHKAVIQLLLDNQADIEVKDQDNRSPLALAARNGHMAAIKLLLDNKADIEVRDQDGRSPLALAVTYAYGAVMKRLLNDKASSKARDQDGYLPFTLAVMNGHKAIIKLLLDNKADVASKDFYGYSPLMVAIEQGYIPIIELLLDNNADIESKDNHGRSLLMVAIEKGRR
ncbi:unnamed protein product, partial [Clonostachys byssicola]